MRADATAPRAYYLLDFSSFTRVSGEGEGCGRMLYGRKDGSGMGCGQDCYGFPGSYAPGDGMGSGEFTENSLTLSAGDDYGCGRELGYGDANGDGDSPRFGRSIYLMFPPVDDIRAVVWYAALTRP